MNLGCAKPDPAFFQNILARLDLPPEACLAVGNDYAKDILPAKAAGLLTVWYCPQSDRREPNEADAVIEDMRDLIRAIPSLENS